MTAKATAIVKRLIDVCMRLLDFPKVLLFAFPLTVWSLAVLAKLYHPLLYGWFVKEDGIVEYATALFYLLACFLGILIFRSFRQHNVPDIANLYLILSIGFAFICGEEISWGQRLFGIETPEYIAQYNQQGESNLHNTLNSQWIHLLYIAVALYGMFGWHLVRRRVDWIVPNFSEWCLPNPSLFLYFAPTFLVYSFFDFLSPLGMTYFGDSFGWGKGHFVIARDQELAELFLSIAFCIFLIQTIKKLIAIGCFVLHQEGSSSDCKQTMPVV